MNHKTRKLITIHKTLYPRYAIHKLSVSRKGGRGIVSIEDCMLALINGMNDFTKKNKERLITAASNSNNSRYNLRTNRETTIICS